MSERADIVAFGTISKFSAESGRGVIRLVDTGRAVTFSRRNVSPPDTPLHNGQSVRLVASRVWV